MPSQSSQCRAWPRSRGPAIPSAIGTKGPLPIRRTFRGQSHALALGVAHGAWPYLKHEVKGFAAFIGPILTVYSRLL